MGCMKTMSTLRSSERPDFAPLPEMCFRTDLTVGQLKHDPEKVVMRRVTQRLTLSCPGDR
jgi:hypothetical protein